LQGKYLCPGSQEYVNAIAVAIVWEGYYGPKCDTFIQGCENGLGYISQPYGAKQSGWIRSCTDDDDEGPTRIIKVDDPSISVTISMDSLPNCVIVRFTNLDWNNNFATA